MFIRKYMHSSEIITEGWGFAVSMLLPGVNLINILRAGKKFGILMQNPKLQKYILSECDIVLAQAKKENPKVIAPKTINGKKITWGQRLGLDDDTTTSEKFKYWRYAFIIGGKYIVNVFVDTTHIQKFTMTLFNPETDKYFYKALKAPNS